MSAHWVLLALVLLLLNPSLTAAQTGDGWAYRRADRKTSGGGSGPIHLFRVDPGRFRPDLLLAGDSGAQTLTSQSYREGSGAALVINGGFFDERYRSLGLLVRRGEKINPLRNVAWGVFFVSPRGPAIVHRRDLDLSGVQTAIQVGPRLVVDGVLPPLKQGVPARRSAIGVTAEGWILVALSEALIDLREWAAILKGEVPQALNLDGGGSTQISVKFNGLSLDVPGTSGVPNAVAFFPRRMDQTSP